MVRSFIPLEWLAGWLVYREAKQYVDESRYGGHCGLLLSTPPPIQETADNNENANNKNPTSTHIFAGASLSIFTNLAV